jgi:hypothetical protein
MLHTLPMSILIPRLTHSLNVKQLYDRPWTSYHCPYVTHSYNVQPYFTLWTLFKCQSTVRPTTIHMLHTFIMSILTSRFGHSLNVNQLHDRPWTSYDCPYVTHSANVHLYFMTWTLCGCPCTFLRLLFCATPCVHTLPPMMVFIQVHHPCNPSGL